MGTEKQFSSNYSSDGRATFNFFTNNIAFTIKAFSCFKLKTKQLLLHLATASDLLVHKVESFTECRDQNEFAVFKLIYSLAKRVYRRRFGR